MLRRALAVTMLAALVAAACGGATTVDEVPAIPSIEPGEFRELIATSPLPVVANVWASWCGPCRSEAPLLRAAAAEWGDRVAFVGIDVRDTQEAGRAFIAEFGLTDLDHRFDATGAVPRDLGGVGVPLTYFFFRGGDLAYLHRGVIDERTLVLWLDTIAGAG